MSEKEHHGRRLLTWLAGITVFVAGLIAQDVYGLVRARVFPAENREPLVIAVSADPKDWGQSNPFRAESFGYVIPLPLATIERPPRGACYHRFGWARRHLGVDADTTRLRLVLQAPSESAVLLEQVVPVIHRRRPAMEGIHAACPVGGASTNTRRLTVDLDQGMATLEDGEGTAFAPTMLKFAKGESEVVDVAATARNARYDWALKLVLIVDGERAVALIPDRGELFSTTARRAAETMHWAAGKWRRGEGPPVSGLLPQ